MTRNPDQSVGHPRRPWRRPSGGATALALGLGVGLAGCHRAPEPPPRPLAVRVAAVQQLGAARELRLSGTLEAERSTSLSFAVPGTVEEVLVAEGAAVAAGQPLARLDARNLRDGVRVAQARADQAQDAWRRLEPLHRNATVPEVKWIEVDTGLQQAQAALSMARKNLSDAVLRAPEAGVIARRSVEAGTTAVPGVPAFTLIQSRVVLATAPVPERQVAGVRVGAPARVEVAALGRSFEGTVRELGVAADPLTRTYPVKVAVPNAGGALRVGMVADVYLALPAAGGPVLAVPPEAVRLDDQGQPCVWRVEGAPGGTRVRRQRVVVDGYAGEALAVRGGLAEGARVVVSGTPMLAEGMAVSAQGGEEAK